MRITYTSDTGSRSFWLILYDSRPIYHRQSMVKVSAACRPLYRSTLDRCFGRPIDRHSADVSVDMSTDISRLIYQPSVGQVSVNISADTSLECQSICRPIYRSRGAQNTHDPGNFRGKRSSWSSYFMLFGFVYVAYLFFCLWLLCLF